MISGIAGASQLIEAASGTDMFIDRAAAKLAKEQNVTATEVVARQPEIIVGSRCGKKFRLERVAAYPVSEGYRLCSTAHSTKSSRRLSSSRAGRLD